MGIRRLFQHTLDPEPPWFVEEVEVDYVAGEVVVYLGYPGGHRFECPVCSRACGVYDTKNKEWRHLDAMGLKTVIRAGVPRVRCPEHGVRLAGVSWARPLSRLTRSFELWVWLVDASRRASVSAVARRTGCSRYSLVQLQKYYDEALDRSAFEGRWVDSMFLWPLQSVRDFIEADCGIGGTTG